MKKLITLILGITLVYSCSSSSDGNSNSTDLNIPGPDVMDIEGNLYQTVINCNQTWTKSNLNVSKYRNGDVIPQVTDFQQWKNLTTGAWCYFDNDPANGAIYGKLYNWYAVNDPRGLAPAGYHIPSVVEWTTLKTCLGGENVAGGKMKATGTTLWLSPNTAATNSSGFTGLPLGRRGGDGGFSSFSRQGIWWSSLEQDAYTAWDVNLIFDSASAYTSTLSKKQGCSVRCVKD